MDFEFLGGIKRVWTCGERCRELRVPWSQEVKGAAMMKGNISQGYYFFYFMSSGS